MNYLVISDIHGSLNYTNFILEKLNTNQFEHIIILGDQLYHGPRNPLPKEYSPLKVAEILQKFRDKITAIRGNCDSEVDEMVLGYSIMETTKEIEVEGLTIILNHGHHKIAQDMTDFNKKYLVLSGHTHVPTAHNTGNIYYCNPGSISLPKENYPNSYGILTNKSFRVLDLITDEEIMKIEF